MPIFFTYIYLYWNSSTLATSCEELTHWKRLWCCEGLGAGGEGDDRGWDGWMASWTRWMWVWVNSGRWWWTGRPGVLRFMGSQRVGHDRVTELNWTDTQNISFTERIPLKVSTILKISGPSQQTYHRMKSPWDGLPVTCIFPTSWHLPQSLPERQTLF